MWRRRRRLERERPPRPARRPESPRRRSATGAPVYDVTCYWSLTGVRMHTFASPLEITLSSADWDGPWSRRPSKRSVAADPARADGGNAAVGVERRLLRRLGRDPHPDEAPVRVHAAPRSLPTAAAARHERCRRHGRLTLRWAGIRSHRPDRAGAALRRRRGDRDVRPDAVRDEAGLDRAGDPRTFVLTETDPAGNYSAPTVGLRALPPLAGRSIADATHALAASGFATGTVTTWRPRSRRHGALAQRRRGSAGRLGRRPDRVGRPGGSTLRSSWGLSARRLPSDSAAHDPATVAVTEAGTTTIVLVDARGRRLASWRRTLRAGVNQLQLQLPRPVRRTGSSTARARTGSRGRRKGRSRRTAVPGHRKRMLVLVPPTH